MTDKKNTFASSLYCQIIELVVHPLLPGKVCDKKEGSGPTMRAWRRHDFLHPFFRRGELP
jgi:hypothetical protein